jgi:hypothetical protein
VELRRALLLFAIVLGLAAIVTSFSRPAQRENEDASDGRTVQPGRARAGPRRMAPQPVGISFSTTGEPRREQLAANRPATVTVATRQPGEVELAGLGLAGAAEPLTPARLEVLETRPGRYRVRFTPAGTEDTRTVGTLRIVDRRR